MTIVELPSAEGALVLPDTAAIDQVIGIVNRITQTKRPGLPVSEFERRWTKIENWLMAIAIPAGLVTVAVGLLAIWLHSTMLLRTMLWIAAVCELFAIAMMGAGIVRGTPFLWRLRKAPYIPFLTMVRLSVEQDLPVVRDLGGCQKASMQYVLAQYKQERNAFERRSGMIAGSLDRVGIFAAMAGLVLTVTNLMKVSDSVPWGMFFGPLLLMLCVQAVAAAAMIQKMDRVIALLELSIQTKQ